MTRCYCLQLRAKQLLHLLLGLGPL
jgi:hypothetical protein